MVEDFFNRNSEGKSKQAKETYILIDVSNFESLDSSVGGNFCVLDLDLDVNLEIKNLADLQKQNDYSRNTIGHINASRYKNHYRLE